nr:unnamed protein product [Callosobruchus chinensis]
MYLYSFEYLKRDLAPSDFLLFAHLKIMLAGKKFRIIEEIIAKTEAYFEGKDKSFCKNEARSAGRQLKLRNTSSSIVLPSAEEEARIWKLSKRREDRFISYLPWYLVIGEGRGGSITLLNPFSYTVLGKLLIVLSCTAWLTLALSLYGSLKHLRKRKSRSDLSDIAETSVWLELFHVELGTWQFVLRYKDDKLYPWALPVSHLILFPESANQTIYTQSVTPHDAGNYTCVLKNDTVVHSHTIHLKVFDEVPDDPKITYISQDTSVRVGDSLRLFCEAFGGQVDLPDAHSDAYWQKVGANGTVYDVPDNVQQLKSDSL